MANIGAWPTLSKVPEQFSFGLRSTTMVHLSPLSGDTQRVYLDGAKWLMSWQYDWLANDDAAKVEAFASRLRGSLNTFTFIDPSYIRRGTFDHAAATYNANYAKGVTSVAFTHASQAGRTLLAGDRFSDSDGDLYIVAADATANGSGSITVTIEPPTRKAKSSGAAVNTSAANMAVTMMLTEQNWLGRAQAGRPGVRSYAFEAVSTLNP